MKKKKKRKRENFEQTLKEFFFFNNFLIFLYLKLDFVSNRVYLFIFLNLIIRKIILLDYSSTIYSRIGKNWAHSISSC